MIKVAAALIRRGSRLLAARRSESGRHPGKWEFPGGKIENGETPQECLKRELKEEFSVEVDVGELFLETYHRYDFGDVYIGFYEARITCGILKPAVHSEFAWLSNDDLRSYDFLPADRDVIEKLARD